MFLFGKKVRGRRSDNFEAETVSYVDWIGWMVGYLPGAILRAPDGANECNVH